MTVSSPCIDVCLLDPRTKLCRGCHRTVEEIAAWPTMADEDRLALRETLAERARRSKLNRQG